MENIYFYVTPVCKNWSEELIHFEQSADGDDNSKHDVYRQK